MPPHDHHRHPPHHHPPHHRGNGAQKAIDRRMSDRLQIELRLFMGDPRSQTSLMIVSDMPREQKAACLLNLSALVSAARLLPDGADPSAIASSVFVKDDPASIELCVEECRELMTPVIGERETVQALAHTYDGPGHAAVVAAIAAMTTAVLSAARARVEA